MGAVDCIVTKAGPGTIAEATTRGLPVMLSAFLPGQEVRFSPLILSISFIVVVEYRPRLCSRGGESVAACNMCLERGRKRKRRCRLCCCLLFVNGEFESYSFLFARQPTCQPSFVMYVCAFLQMYRRITGALVFFQCW